MTSMTEVGGLVSTAPQWRLGEMAQLLNDHMHHKIESLDDLTLYMQRNDADQLYGARMLAQIEAILEDVRRNGISKDLAVAVESTRPGTIPPNVQKLLTRNYTGTFQKETVVALESWKEAGRMGLIVLLITAILKIISWIVSNGKGYKGNTNPKASAEAVKDFQAKTEEKWQAAPENPPAEVKEKDHDAWRKEFEATLNGISNASLRSAVLASAKKAKNMRQCVQVNASAMRFDDLLSKVGASDYIDTVTVVSGRNPFIPVFDSMVTDNVPRVGFDALISQLMSMNITDGVFEYKPAAKAYSMLPKGMREAGVRIPDFVTFRVTINRGPELAEFFIRTSKAFEELASTVRSRRAEGAVAPEDVKGAAENLGYAVQRMNEVLANSINVVKGLKFQQGELSTIAIDERDADNLIGWDSPTEFVGGKVLVSGTYSSFLNSGFISAYQAKHRLTDDDCTGIMAALVSLANGLSSDSRVTNFNMYEKLQGAVEDCIDSIEEWEKSARNIRGAGDYIDKVGDLVMVILNEARSDSLDHGREISLSYNDRENSTFWEVLRTNVGYVRRMCMGAIGMQQVLNNADRNPFIKGKD